MIVDAILKAVGQIGDPRFTRVLALGIGLTLALLLASYVGIFYLVDWLLPESFDIPWLGEIGFVDEMMSGASVLLLLVASVFLMVPVASAFTSIFLEEVAEAVEDRHYPHAPQVPRIPFLEGLRDGATFLGVLIAANLAALILYLIFPPFAPAIFLAMNGYLLGREYFQITALRRLGRAEARTMRKRYTPTIWLAGCALALPLSVPILNLTVPVIGAAAFTHLYHRLAAEASARPSRYRAR